MESFRKVSKVVKGERTVDGAGVNLVRVLGRNTVKDFDPFLMLDSFDSKDPQDYIKGFPWHPHRGIETITYLVKGDIEHGDSLGNKGSILDGDCQWMTGGSGIVHQEMPKASERMLGVQLWLNLPAKDKMAPPQYRDITQNIIPCLQENGGDIRIISGCYKEVSGAIQGDYIKPLFIDIDLKPNQEWTMETVENETLFTFLLEGEANFNPTKDEYQGEKSAVLFDSGKNLWIKAGDQGARILLLMAPPLKEPIAWGGPIVMNTNEELTQAFDELEKGTFIK